MRPLRHPAPKAELIWISTILRRMGMKAQMIAPMDLPRVRAAG